MWGPTKVGCYACRTCPMWNPPASFGERRARQTHMDEDTTADSEWTIREWNGTEWVDLEVVRGHLARDAALRE